MQRYHNMMASVIVVVVRGMVVVKVVAMVVVEVKLVAQILL